jgi:hypothetical protein
MGLTTKALQLEMGLSSWISDGMKGELLITREMCRGDMETDGEAGCFGTVGNRSATISRAAIQVSYLTGGDLK